MSLREFFLAVEGLAESKGGGKKGSNVVPLSRSEFEDLAAEFPDVPNTRRRSGARSP